MPKKIKTIIAEVAILLIIILGIGYFTFVAFASDSGALSPGTMADTVGVGNVPWTNPTNVASSNDVYATAVGDGLSSHYLKATNFSFSIPVGAVINGILVEVERHRGVGTIKDVNVKIVKADGTIGATNKADTATNWPTSDTYGSYGSSSDLWGETWASTDINDVDFGMVISTSMTGLGATASIDHIRITVYYTLSSNTSQIQIRSGSISIKSGSIKLQ